MSALTLAIPSKGRLKDETLSVLSDAGLAVAPADERSYETSIPALPGVRVLLLPASEIAARLKRGDFHAGVTGEDVLREEMGSLDGAADHLSVLTIGAGGPVRVKRLGFGPARLVVAVPQAWFDAETMADLAEIGAEMRARRARPLRVATKFLRLTRAFFAAKLVTDYRIVLSTGATEAAPASGLADLIVDITTSGATLRGNKLKILDDGEIFASEAALFLAPETAPVWQDASRELLARLVAPLKGD